MFKVPANDQMFKRYIDLFGYLFKDIVLERFDATGKKIQKQTVPIEFGPMEPYVERNEEDPNLNKSVAVNLPRMSYELTSFYYDTTRALASSQVLYDYTSAANPQIRFVGVPYNLTFNLYIQGRIIDDNWKIMESILPYFTPNLTINADILDNGNPYEITFNIATPSEENIFEGKLGDYTKLMWTVPFMMQGYLFGPNQAGPNGKKVIKWIKTDILVENDVNTSYGDGLLTIPQLANTATDNIKSTDSYEIVTESISANSNISLANGYFVPS